MEVEATDLLSPKDILPEPEIIPASTRADAKAPYPPAASLPNQLGARGTRLDFNLGARMVLPSRTEGGWRVALGDLDTGSRLFHGEKRGSFVNSAKRRPMKQPYVCIAIQSLSQAKPWNNSRGWREVVAFPKDSGDRVVCIDQRAAHGAGLTWPHIPHSVEHQTGDTPLAEQARRLHHAGLFVGRSSGLLWLAWAAGCPVVLISDFTHPINGLATPCRVVSWDACNGGWNNLRAFQPQEFPVMPAPHRHAPALRVHPADHRAARDAGPPGHSRLRRSQNEQASGCSRHPLGPERDIACLPSRSRPASPAAVPS